MGDHNDTSPTRPPATSINQSSHHGQPSSQTNSSREPFLAPAPPNQQRPGPLPTTPSQYQSQESTASGAPNTSRPRKDSRPPPILHQPQPVKDAVNAAFDNAPASANLDAEFEKRLIEQVTEQVIKNLHLANLPGGPTPTSSTHSQAGQTVPAPRSDASRSSPQRSPTYSSTGESFPPRFTPPSPNQEREAYYRSKGSSPERVPSDAGSSFSKQSQESIRSHGSTQSNKETTPRASRPEVIPGGLKRSKTTAFAGQEMGASDALPRRRGSSEATARGPSRRDSRGSFDGVSRSKARPPVVDEVSSDTEEPTLLEQHWKPLFTNDGSPTPRLGQFLRGLAKHIIDDYEPKGSLVIGPKKMLRFLTEAKVDREHYPWQTIFGGKMCFDSISIMYRKLLCQHHFFQQQQQFQDAPSVPGLTPTGFAQFMTCLIQAHPDTEFERLSLAVRDMPISNADDCKERFPKQLSRKLLPKNAVVQAEQRIISSLHHEPDLVPLERVINAMPPPPTSAPPSASPQQAAFPERERAPYSSTAQQSNAVDDEDLNSIPSVPLERERKPYFAKEGTGKQYDTEANADRERERERDRERERERDRERDRSSREPSRPNATQYRTDYPPPRSSRQASNAPPPGMYSSSGGTDPMNIPPTNRNHRVSTGPMPPAGSYSKSGRRSPPPRSGYRSEPMDINAIPSSQYASNLHGPPPRDRFAGDPDEDVLRSYDNRRPGRNMADDDYSGRPIPPRNIPSQPPNGYDQVMYGSGSIPSSNFPPNRDSMPRGPEDRRRSWFPAAGGAAGGTDGYGSYANGSNAYGATSGH